jgi:hypothetical protein
LPDRRVRARAGAERTHSPVDADPFTRWTVHHHDRAGRLRRHSDPVRVEARIERGLHRGHHDREIRGTAASKHRARGNPLERRLALRRRDEPQRPGPVAAAYHRLHPLRRRRNDRQPIAPTPLEHVLELIEAAERLLEKAARDATRLRPRLSINHDPEQRRVALGVPPHHPVSGATVDVDPHRRRDRVDAEAPAHRIRSRIDEHRLLEARASRQTRGDLRSLLRNAHNIRAPDRRQPAQREHRRGAVRMNKDHHRRRQSPQREWPAVDTVEQDIRHPQSLRMPSQRMSRTHPRRLAHYFRIAVPLGETTYQME